jgi:cytochrome c oxidase subunit 2
MTAMSRREWLGACAVATFSAISDAVGGTPPVAAGGAGAAPVAREIAIQAQRFRYAPDEIPCRSGETLVLAVTAIDFAHGFDIPELGIRADLVPGLVVRIALPPLSAGSIEFLCDNFCGEGHEQMHGRLIVSA